MSQKSTPSSIKYQSFACLLLNLFATLLHSCVYQSESKTLNTVIDYTDIIYVDTIHIKKRPFHKELLATGKLQSPGIYEIVALHEGIIKEQYFKTGQLVHNGQLISRTENKQVDIEYLIAKQKVNIALLKLEDLLIGFGYKLSDTSKVPDKLLKNTMMTSGFYQAQLALKQASLKKEMLEIRAPATGLIGNKEVVEGTYLNKGQKICDLIVNNTMECTFSILETDISDIKIGQKVKLQLLSNTNKIAYANIVSINPYVSDEGMVNVVARLNDTTPSLFHGMNVNVSVMINRGNNFHVPKNAVLLRDGKDVIFTYDKGKAQWNFVQVRDENSEYLLINEGINEGDTIIISNTLHLNHNTPVTITP